MKSLLSVLIFILLPFNILLSQEDPIGNAFYYNARIHYGSIILHSKDIKDIGKGYPKGIELSLVNQLTSKKAWESCNCYPRRGITLGFWDFDKPEILGQGYLANFFIEPVFGGWKQWFFSVKAAFGVAYLTKPYNEVTNPYNLSYSTNVSFPLHLGTTLNYRLSERSDVGLTLIYNHLSNGGLKEPNKGINWPSIALSYDYKPNAYKLLKYNSEKYVIEEDERYTGSLFLFGTGKQLNHSELTKYFIGGITAHGSYRIGRLSALTAGAEFEWDESDREEVRRDPLINADHKKAAIYAGHEFLLGRFTFCQALAVYLYAPYNPNDPLYQKYTLLYSWNDKYSAGISLKAHRQVADYLSFIVGYRVFR
jgi:hypothetical protein